MLKIQVKNSAFVTRSWNDKTTGEVRSMNIQQILVFLTNSEGQVDETPDKVELILANKQLPYPVGVYQLTPECIYLDRNGRLQVSLTHMKPIVVRQQAAA